MSGRTEKLLEMHTHYVKRKRTSLNLSADLYSRLRGFCNDRGVQISDLIDALIKDFLDGQIVCKDAEGVVKRYSEYPKSSCEKCGGENDVLPESQASCILKCRKCKNEKVILF